MLIKVRINLKSGESACVCAPMSMCIYLYSCISEPINGFCFAFAFLHIKLKIGIMVFSESDFCYIQR